ncbi:INCE protein, partial [Cephalopterus ornatus]|nr:INCE protein [Cephalopterus ornatus]
IKDFIKRNTPTRPNLKCKPFSLQEKERQRLENLRKKQEAEEQRKKKVEEEKRRRQAEMKQKREERLRKALQARERVEEEKKKRMEQKILQSDEKVREEKVSEERSKRKTLKKHGDTDARKQKALRGVRAAQLPPARLLHFLLQEENEQQEPLQKRREDEVKEKGKKVLELKNLLEQQQVEKVKKRCELGIGHRHREAVNVNVVDPKQRGKEKPPQAQLEAAVLADKTTKVGDEGECGLWGAGLDLSRDRTGRRGKAQATSSCERCPRRVAEQTREGYSSQVFPQKSGGEEGLRAGVKAGSPKSLSTSCLVPPKGVQGPGSPSADENNYGLDLNSDDSTDDENDPRKPVPAWANGAQLHQAILHQYYHPVDVDALFGAIPSPQLEHIFYKSKPRYFKRTSSAVWHSPP